MNPERSDASRLYGEFNEAVKQIESNPITKVELKHPELQSQADEIRKELENLAEEEENFVQQIKEGTPIEQQDRLHELTEQSDALYYKMLKTLDTLYDTYTSEQKLLAERIEELEQRRKGLNNFKQKIEPYIQLFTGSTEGAQKLDAFSTHQKDIARELVETRGLVKELNTSLSHEREKYDRLVPFNEAWHKRNLALRNASYEIRNKQARETMAPSEPDAQST